MYHLWNAREIFPEKEDMHEIKDIEFVDVHTAVKGEYHFLLGAAIIKHNNQYFTSWGNSFRGENDDNTIFVQKTSKDRGKTWNDYKTISSKEIGFGRSHGVFFEFKNKLYAFCPKAKFDKIDAYPELKMEAYTLNSKGEWDNIGIVLEDSFWPMCEPIVLDNGTILIAGLETINGEGAVALCRNGDLTKWEMKTFPNPRNYSYWGETTVLKEKDRLVAIVRGHTDIGRALISESFNDGEEWTALEKSNFPISPSKMYAGTLRSGKNYMIFNASTDAYRETLCIAVGEGTFNKVFCIRHGFDDTPRFWHCNEWCYPYAYEDCDTNKLYVVYAKNKEDCELAIIPIESLK